MSLIDLNDRDVLDRLTFLSKLPDWNSTTYEEATQLNLPPVFVYAASKKLAEEAAWKYAKENQLNIVARKYTQVIQMDQVSICLLHE